MNESSSEKSFSSDEFADEGDWYASLVAGERVGEWLDVIESAVEEKEEEDFLDASSSSSESLLKKAISNLTLKVREDETYGEEAEVAEAERRVREALEKVRARKCEKKKEEKDPQEDVSILLEKSVDALETYRKKKKSAKTYAIKDGRVEVSILETKLSNGVGGKLWKAALLLAEQLDDERDEGEGERGVGIDVKDKTGLELGAGVGLVGLAAAKLGAKEVVLSDFEAPLLEALEESVKRNELVGKGEEKTTKVRWLDWRADGAGEEGTPAASKTARRLPRARKEDAYDIILGSDCLYESHRAALPKSHQKTPLSLSKLPLSPPRRRAQPRHVGPITRTFERNC